MIEERVRKIKLDKNSLSFDDRRKSKKNKT